LLKNPPADPFASVERAGVAIRRVQNGFHMALLYRVKDACRLLHLTMDRGLQDIEPDDVYCWLPTGLDKFNKLTLSAICRDIAEKAKTSASVPYRFWYNGDYFDISGGYIADPNAGLTCSTFILAVLRAIKIELVKVDEWPSAKGQDLTAQMQITVGAGHLHPPQPFLVNALQDEWEKPRFSPGQVAAAAHDSSHPIGYKKACKMGGTIEERLTALRPA
jgi:hypothetical protein